MVLRIGDTDRMLSAMEQLRARMNRLFADLDWQADYWPGFTSTDGMPRTNLYDTGDNLEIKAEMPGVLKQDLQIKLQGNYLEIAGKRKTPVPAGFSVNRSERGEAEFTRSFTLPCGIESERVEAKLANGILLLKMPKAEAAKPKQISIQ